MDKTIRRLTDLDEQLAETYRYWESRPVDEQLIAVCELGEAAYAFAADLKERRPMMTKDFKDLLRALNASAVKYLIIGGHAFSVHSEPRTTKDLDVFIRSEPENAKAAFRALTQFGAPLHGLTEVDFVDGTTF
jgi:hypothetical protein